MQLREVSEGQSCSSLLAMPRTVSLSHRAKRTHVRGYWGGGWVELWCGEGPGAGPGAVCAASALVS